MKDLLFIPIILATFAFGYYVVAKFGDFIEENQRLIAEGNRNGRCHIRIAAENPLLLDSVAAALENCSEAEPHIEFFLSFGRNKHLLNKLLNEQIDILLLAEESSEPLEPQYAFTLISCEKPALYTISLGLSVENLDEEKWMRVVWKKDLKSKNRDRVIAVLEMELPVETKAPI